MIEPSVPVSVTVPARADCMRILRSVAASVASGLEFSYERVDEVRMLVGEAAAIMLQSFPDATSLHLVEEVNDGDIRTIIGVNPTKGTWPPEGLELTWPWMIISGLADEARCTLDGGRPSIVVITKGPAS